MILTVYTSHARGSTWRETPCHFCGRVYFYHMTRVATGSGNTDDYSSAAEAQQAAVRLAAERLEKLLAEDFELVPCPNCGSYQPDMCEELLEQECNAARKRSNALIGLVGVCFLAAAWSFAPGLQRDGLDIVQIPALVLGLVLLLPALVARQRYNDKRDGYNANAGPPEPRLKIARKHALTAAQLRERLKAEAEAEPKPWNTDARGAE